MMLLVATNVASRQSTARTPTNWNATRSCQLLCLYIINKENHDIKCNFFGQLVSLGPLLLIL